MSESPRLRGASVSRRFYFVGDEDLLEIIGNSKNVAKLQKHFKKMFAGVSSILLNEDSTEVLGISSREGEEVRLVRRERHLEHLGCVCLAKTLVTEAPDTRLIQCQL